MKGKVLIIVAVVVATLGLVGTAAAVLVVGRFAIRASDPGEAVQVDREVQVASVEEYAIALEGSSLLVEEAYGYSLLYPEGFAVEYPSEGTVLISGPVPQAGTRAELFITTRSAEGRTAADEADWRYNDVRFLITEDMDVRRSTLTLGGIDAVQIDGLPGAQDMNRRVLVVRDGVLYDLMFVPMDPAYPDVVAQVEALYSMVVESFAFAE